MAPSILFAFGPEESFFFYCPVKTISHRTSYTFNSVVPSKIGLIYHVSLAPGDNEYCALYMDKDNRLYHSINILTTKNLKPIVDRWTAHFNVRPMDLLKSRLVLGPGNTFIAISPFAIFWEVARPLRDMMEKRGYGPGGSENPEEGSMITEAALGHGGAWWLKFENGTDNWNFAGGYRELEQLFRSGVVDTKTINYLTLSPFSNEHYFMVYEGNKVRYSLPASFATPIARAMDEYHASLVSVSGAHTGIEGSGGSVGKVSTKGSDEPPPYDNNNAKDRREFANKHS